MISGRKQWSDGTPVAGQQFEYSFDDIGNRTRSKFGGDETGGNLRQTDCVANRLNQYTSKNNPATADVIGLAKGTTVTLKLNGTSVGAPYRRGEYFRKEVTVRPGSSAATGTISFDVDATTPPSTTGTVGVPAATESGATLSYDADGNLTADSLWVYAWDGENRLKQMTAQDASKRLVFEYDYRSRRVLKQVFIPSSATTATTTEKYLYDGWNPVAIWDGSTVIQKSFLWGMDLSGSSQSAGGVGGLVAYRQHTGTSAGRYFVAYDGNGNIIGLQSSAGGSPSAAYEYGPFGEVIRVSGTVGKLNPFRFSTKFQDDESDFLYYGYRFYNASIGRWPSRDPIGEKGGMGLYAFVNGNPNDLHDRFGFRGTTSLEDLEDALDAMSEVADTLTDQGEVLDVAVLGSSWAIGTVLFFGSTTTLNGGEDEFLERSRSYSVIDRYEKKVRAEEPDDRKLNRVRLQLQTGTKGHVWSIRASGHFPATAIGPATRGVYKVQIQYRLDRMWLDVISHRTSFPISESKSLWHAIIESSRKIQRSSSIGPEQQEIIPLRVYFQTSCGRIYRIDVRNENGVNFKK